METAARRRLGDIFVGRGLITNEQLETALEAQRTGGGKLGEVLVELGFVTRVALAGVITEQWDELRVTARGRTNAEQPARNKVSPIETALRDRIELLTRELEERDRRIVQQDETIAALLSRLPREAA